MLETYKLELRDKETYFHINASRLAHQYTLLHSSLFPHLLTTKIYIKFKILKRRKSIFKSAESRTSLILPCQSTYVTVTAVYKSYKTFYPKKPKRYIEHFEVCRCEGLESATL